VPNANSEYYRYKAAEYERLIIENAGSSMCEEFRRAKQVLIALAQKEEWLSRGTLSREPQWATACPRNLRPLDRPSKPTDEPAPFIN
jgi:hypothetical protein